MEGLTFLNLSQYNVIFQYIENIEFVLSVPDERISVKAKDLLETLKDANLFRDISKETFGATVLYVARDIFKVPYTFTRVQNELGITNVSKLSQKYKQIINFIKQNPRILK